MNILTFATMNNEAIDIEKILNTIGIKALNAMQIESIQAFENKHDIVLLSNTGTGKTLAFLLPLLQKLLDAKFNTKVMVIVPSRELAMQIEKVFKSLQTGIKITCCYGGHKRETEENNLIQPPAILVGTPGRLADHIRRNNIDIENIDTLIIDEFDKLLEMNFEDEMKFIIQSAKNIDKRILTSATQLDEYPSYVGLGNFETINYITEETSEALAIRKVVASDKDKIDSLVQLLSMQGARSTIIFCNHREAVERTSKMISERGIQNEYYHGAMEQRERDSALCKFRNGTVHFLVTTDLASRGLDIANIRYIVHYHMPATEEIYTHRNGRTARMEASGTVTLLVSKDEKIPSFIPEDLEELELLDEYELPEKPKWTTLFIAAGKKDRINKIDIVGFFSNRGNLKQEDIGLIEVKDFFSFVAVKKIYANDVLHRIRDERIKNKKVKMEIAK
jgi:superfamily II DNA/RNA helicase